MSTAQNTNTTYAVQRRTGDTWDTLDVYATEAEAEATLARYRENHPQTDFGIAVDLDGTDENVDPGRPVAEHDGEHEWSRPEESAITHELIEVCMIGACDASRRAEADRIVHHSTTGESIEIDVFVTGRGWTVYRLDSTQARQLGEGLIVSADMLEAQFTLTIDGEYAWSGDRAEVTRQILELIADSEVPVDAHFLELSQRRSVLDAVTSFVSGETDELLVDLGGRGTDKARQRIGISRSIGGPLMTAQPRDGHRLERPVIVQSVPRWIVASRCECGVRFEGSTRFVIKAEHKRHRIAALADDRDVERLEGRS